MYSNAFQVLEGLPFYVLMHRKVSGISALLGVSFYTECSYLDTISQPLIWHNGCACANQSPLPLNTFFNSLSGDWQENTVLIINASFSVHICHIHRDYMSEKIWGSYFKLFDLTELDDVQCCRANTALLLWADFCLVPVLGWQCHLLGFFWELTYFLAYFLVARDPLPSALVPSLGLLRTTPHCHPLLITISFSKSIICCTNYIYYVFLYCGCYYLENEK